MSPWKLALCACIWAGALGVGNASETHVGPGRWPVHPVPTKESEVPAWSQTIKLRASLGACLDAAAGEVDKAQACLAQEHTYQDARLNRSYKKLMSQLAEDDRKALRLEERDWIAFRDRFCAAQGDVGQQGELDHYECLVDQTADRATELETKLARK